MSVMPERAAMSPLTKKCEVCGSEFRTKKSHYERRRTCARECLGVLYKTELVGERNPNFRQAKVVTNCPVCGKEFLHFPSMGHRVHCSKECSAKTKSINFVGPNNPQWTGGDKHYGPNWYMQSDLARLRDDYLCKVCGQNEQAIGRKMDVHHIKPFRLFSDAEEANALDNLISLCPGCHRNEEAKARSQYGFEMAPPKPYAPPTMYTPADAARVLGVTTWAIYALIKRGKIAPLDVWSVNPKRKSPRYMLSQDELDHLANQKPRYNKLTESEKDDIRLRYSQDNASYETIARDYGVTRSVIGHIVRKGT
jgi:5-methylcytosine-specific restriction endonuclease McrA